jgi:hypothetical protein
MNIPGEEEVPRKRGKAFLGDYRKLIRGEDLKFEYYALLNTNKGLTTEETELMVKVLDKIQSENGDIIK